MPTHMAISRPDAAVSCMGTPAVASLPPSAVAISHQQEVPSPPPAYEADPRHPRECTCARQFGVSSPGYADAPSLLHECMTSPAANTAIHVRPVHAPPIFRSLFRLLFLTYFLLNVSVVCCFVFFTCLLLFVFLCCPACNRRHKCKLRGSTFLRCHFPSASTAIHVRPVHETKTRR